jgi:hypothetical protein
MVSKLTLLIAIMCCNFFTESFEVEPTCEFFVNRDQFNDQFSDEFIAELIKDSLSFRTNDDNVINVLDLDTSKGIRITDRNIKAQIEYLVTSTKFNCRSLSISSPIDVIEYLGDIDFGITEIKTKLYFVSLQGNPEYVHHFVLGLNINENNEILSCINFSESTIMAGFSDLIYTRYDGSKFMIIKASPSCLPIQSGKNLQRIRLLKSGECR